MWATAAQLAPDSAVAPAKPAPQVIMKAACIGPSAFKADCSVAARSSYARLVVRCPTIQHQSSDGQMSLEMLQQPQDSLQSFEDQLHRVCSDIIVIARHTQELLVLCHKVRSQALQLCQPCSIWYNNQLCVQKEGLGTHAKQFSESQCSFSRWCRQLRVTYSSKFAPCKRTTPTSQLPTSHVMLPWRQRYLCKILPYAPHSASPMPL